MKAGENVVFAIALAGGVALGSAGGLGSAAAAVSGDDTPLSRDVQAAVEADLPGFRGPGEGK
jgi:hypothetical protein